MPNPYFGPCRAGLHPEFGWGEPCQGEAAEFVSVHSPDGETLIYLCTDHAVQAERLPGFSYRLALAPPATPPVVRL